MIQTEPFPDIPFPPAMCLRRGANQPSGSSQSGVAVKFGENGKESSILCRFCSQKLTSSSNQIVVNGRLSHTFKNPRGIVYQITCFSRAEGCITYGEPTREYTWFPGCSWNYAFCYRCLAHLGWFYQGSRESFYGLISDHITESED